MKYLPLLAVALIIAVLRFIVPTEPISWIGAYKDAAHLFVGGLLGAWIYSCHPNIKPLPNIGRNFGNYNLLRIALALTFIELIAFFTRPR